jgi:hypothetical protein
MQMNENNSFPRDRKSKPAAKERGGLARETHSIKAKISHMEK